MKKFLMMLIAVFTMSLAANATVYTGSVSNVQMGSKTPTVNQTITFCVENSELTGNFSIDAMFPPHDIDLSAPINGTYFEATGTATVFGVVQEFTGHITLTQLDATLLEFTFNGETEGGKPVAFTFKGTAE